MDRFEKTMIAIVSIVMIALVYGIYLDVTAEKISLIKSEWKCVSEKTSIRLVTIGTIINPIPRTECVHYVKIDE